MTVSADTLRAGLIARGLPPQVAEGFILNFRDESGLNPAINEIAPIVPGSRGGFGLAQWTGPRRRALEAFAASRGKPVSDVDTQLDFLMTELQGPEAAAASSILAAPDTATAAAAIATNFLRPAPENLQRRVAAYTGGGTPAPRDRQSPAQQPNIGAVAAAYVNGRMSPEDAALYEQGMAEGRFPRVRKRQSQPAPAPQEEGDALAPLAQALQSVRRFGGSFRSI